MLVVKQAKSLGLALYISIVPAPADDVVFVFLIEIHLGSHEVLDDFLTTAVLEVFRPGYADFFAVFIMVPQRVLAY